MPQTPSAITNFSPGQAGRAAAKARPQPPKGATKTFANLLGIEKPAKANSISKKLRSGEASSSAKADEDLASQIASHEAVNNTSDRNVASTGSNPVQFVPGGLTLTFASCIPISGAGTDVSVSLNPAADSSLAMQASGPQPSTPATELHSPRSTSVTPAQDAKTGQDKVRSYETSVDRAARRANVRAENRMIAFAAGISPAVDTAANGSETQAFNTIPAIDAARSPKALAAFPLNVVTKSRETPLAPDPADVASTASHDAQTSLAPNSDQGHEPSSSLSASDAGNNSDQKIAVTVPSAEPTKGPAVVLNSKTHFVPEALHSAAMVSVAAKMAAGASRQDQAEAAGQVAISLSQKQRISELPTAAAPHDDVPPKIATPVSAPSEPEFLQSRDFTQPRTKATSQAAQRLDTITDGSAVAEGHAGDPAYTVSAPEQSTTPIKRGGSSPDALAKDTASHGSASGGPAPTPAEALRSFELRVRHAKLTRLTAA